MSVIVIKIGVLFIVDKSGNGGAAEQRFWSLQFAKCELLVFQLLSSETMTINNATS